MSLPVIRSPRAQNRTTTSLRPYYEHGGITLYHGDCREILHQLETESFDVALTDPPYLVSYTGRWDGERREIFGDSDPSWVVPVFVEIWRILKRDSLCLSFYGWPHAETFLLAWKLIGYRPVSLVVLLKERWGFGHFTRSQHEQLYLLAKGSPAKPQTPLSDVLAWQQPSPQLHPNQKPLGAISKLVSAYTHEGATVLDPFCGSGTTLVAARQLRRKALGIEIEERFCEIAAVRLSQELLDFSEPEASSEQLSLITDAALADG